MEDEATLHTIYSHMGILWVCIYIYMYIFTYSVYMYVYIYIFTRYDRRWGPLDRKSWFMTPISMLYGNKYSQWMYKTTYNLGA